MSIWWAPLEFNQASPFRIIAPKRVPRLLFSIRYIYPTYLLRGLTPASVLVGVAVPMMTHKTFGTVDGIRTHIILTENQGS